MTATIAQLAPSFLVPGLAVAGAAAVSIPILIHILSRRPRKPEPWGAMRFLLAAYRKHRMRTRLEQLLLLAVRCLVVLLLGLALAGPIGSAVGALAGLGGGRLVVFVLDDAVTSGATDAPGHTRFQTLLQTADQLLATLRTSDRIAVVAASRPARVLLEPISDPRVARSQLQELQPSLAAADWAAALQLTDRVLENEKGSARRYAVLLSDFSAGSLRLGDETRADAAKSMRQLGRQATLMALEPFAPADNVQVASFEPERRVVVAQTTGQTPAVNWTVKLRRLTGTEPPAAASVVRVTLANQQPVVQAVQWQAGQREAEVRVFTPLYETGLVTAQAELESSATTADSLAADNLRRSLVHVRQRLTVLVAGGDESDDSPFTPRQWVATALVPVSDRLGWPIEVRMIEPSGIGGPSVNLDEADAMIVLGPDQLTETGVAEIKRWAQAGGLAWFVAPSHGTASLWPQQVASALGLPWAVANEPVDHAPPLLLKTDIAAGAELERLRGELPDQLRPIEIHRRLAVDPASLGSTTDVLLAGTGGEPILIAADTGVGNGRVLWLTTAITPRWTNLPAKPLIVSLTHEVLRASVNRAQPPMSFHPGDRPTLGGVWTAAGRLTAPDGGSVLLVPAEGPREGEPDAVQPIRALQQQGVYRGPASALTVNVQADAADTRTVNRAAWTTLMDEAGPWRSIRTDNPAEAFSAQADRADFTGPLLWAVLALALLETMMARLFSHAKAQQTTD